MELDYTVFEKITKLPTPKITCRLCGKVVKNCISGICTSASLFGLEAFQGSEILGPDDQKMPIMDKCH